MIYQLDNKIYFRVVSSIWYSSVPSVCLVCIFCVPGVQSRNNFHYIRQLFSNHRWQFQSLWLAGQYNKLFRHNQQRHPKWWYRIWSRFCLRIGTKLTETSCWVNSTCFYHNTTGNSKSKYWKCYKKFLNKIFQEMKRILNVFNIKFNRHIIIIKIIRRMEVICLEYVIIYQ